MPSSPPATPRPPVGHYRELPGARGPREMAFYVGRLGFLAAAALAYVGLFVAHVVLPAQVRLTCTRDEAAVHCASVERTALRERRLASTVPIAAPTSAWLPGFDRDAPRPIRVRVDWSSRSRGGPQRARLTVDDGSAFGVTNVTNDYPADRATVDDAATELERQLREAASATVVYSTTLHGVAPVGFSVALCALVFWLASLRTRIVYDPVSGRVVATTQRWLRKPVSQVEAQRAEIQDVVVAVLGPNSVHVPALCLSSGDVLPLSRQGLRVPGGRLRRQATGLRALLDLPARGEPRTVKLPPT